MKDYRYIGKHILSLFISVQQFNDFRYIEKSNLEIAITLLILYVYLFGYDTPLRGP